MEEELLQRLAELAKLMPGGLPDESAAQKMLKEISELSEAAEYGDMFLEACDVAYYYAKLVAMGMADDHIGIPAFLEIITGAEFTDILIGAIAKYEYRAGGGKKDQEREKLLVRSALRRHYGYSD